MEEEGRKVGVEEANENSRGGGGRRGVRPGYVSTLHNWRSRCISGPSVNDQPDPDRRT